MNLPSKINLSEVLTIDDFTVEYTATLDPDTHECLSIEIDNWHTLGGELVAAITNDIRLVINADTDLEQKIQDHEHNEAIDAGMQACREVVL